jgi:ATP-dependent DNA helicase RecG
VSVSVDRAGPTAFGDSRPLTTEELCGAAVRWPRPSALAVPLPVDGAKAQAGALSLGLATVGDLLEHLPRDRREARAIAQLVDG